MEKPYDLKALGERLKGRGLDLAEESVKILAEETFGFIEESAKLSATPYDDMALIVFPQIKNLVFAQVDKIDGVVGG